MHTIYSMRHTAFYLYVSHATISLGKVKKNQQMTPKLANKAFLAKSTHTQYVWNAAFWTHTTPISFHKQLDPKSPFSKYFWFGSSLSMKHFTTHIPSTFIVIVVCMVKGRQYSALTEMESETDPRS